MFLNSIRDTTKIQPNYNQITLAQNERLINLKMSRKVLFFQFSTQKLKLQIKMLLFNWITCLIDINTLRGN